MACTQKVQKKIKYIFMYLDVLIQILIKNYHSFQAQTLISHVPIQIITCPVKIRSVMSHPQRSIFPLSLSLLDLPPFS